MLIFSGLVVLKKKLDYERVSSYNIDIEAADKAVGGEDRLAARASIIVKVTVLAAVVLNILSSETTL